MSDQRAILVSREQRDMEAARGTKSGDEIAAAYDAAGDQPRQRYCETHRHEAWYVDTEGVEWCCDGRDAGEDCDVVDAIVVLLEEA